MYDVNKIRIKIKKKKKKWFKENWNFEYKPRIDNKNKTNLQQHKYLESDSRKMTLQKKQWKVIFQRNFKVKQEGHDVFQSCENKNNNNKNNQCSTLQETQIKY